MKQKYKYKYKYKYKDLDCRYCLNYKKSSKCRYYERCPHILENLPDLLSDGKFNEAVKNAEICETNHKNTLIDLKNGEIKPKSRKSADISKDIRERHDFKTACKTCNYGGVGFICWSKDGTCLKDWYKFTIQRSKKSCPE